MPTRFDLPALSDKDYATLRNELTAAIPKYSAAWTDFNYSDPGITLLQLLCWLGDATLYRIDTLPREAYLNFARLIAGGTGEELDRLIQALEDDVVRDARGRTIYLGDNPIPYDPERLAFLRYLRDAESGAQIDLTDLRGRAFDFWQSPYRAVTAGDFETIVKLASAGVPASSPEYDIKRVIVLADDTYVRVIPVTAYALSYNITTEPPGDPGRLRMVLNATLGVYSLTYLFYAYDRLRDTIIRFIAPRKLVGTPTKVEQPVLNPLVISMQLACLTHADAAKVLQDAYNAIVAFLSPLTGGHNHTGWPYGRRVTRNDVLMAVSAIRGVDHSQPINITLSYLTGLRLGEAALGRTSYLGFADGIGLPLLWSTTIEGLTDTWPFTIGEHASVGVDTVLPMPGN